MCTGSGLHGVRAECILQAPVVSRVVLVGSSRWHLCWKLVQVEMPAVIRQWLWAVGTVTCWVLVDLPPMTVTGTRASVMRHAIAVMSFQIRVRLGCCSCSAYSTKAAIA